MNWKLSYRVLVLSSFLLSCTGLDKGCKTGHARLFNIQSNDIENFCMEFLDSLGITSKVSVHENGRSMTLTVDYIDNFFVSSKTNSLIDKLIIYENCVLYEKVDNFSFIKKYKGFTDIEIHNYKISDIDSIKNIIKEKEIYRYIIPHIFREINSDQMIWLDYTIDDLKNYLSEDDYSFRGDFWDFIFLYVEYGCDKSSKLDQDLEVLIRASQHPSAVVQPSFFHMIRNKVQQSCED